jgi:hypothetical protein
MFCQVFCILNKESHSRETPQTVTQVFGVASCKKDNMASKALAIDKCVVLEVLLDRYRKAHTWVLSLRRQNEGRSHIQESLSLGDEGQNLSSEKS